jgi:hypothetical protein
MRPQSDSGAVGGVCRSCEKGSRILIGDSRSMEESCGDHKMVQGQNPSSKTIDFKKLESYRGS